MVTVASIVLYYGCWASDHVTVVRHLGVISNFFSIMFFASPLLSMVCHTHTNTHIHHTHTLYTHTHTHTHTQAEVVRSKSTEAMSFPLTFMSVCTTLSWVMYGFLVADFYIIVSEPFLSTILQQASQHTHTHTVPKCNWSSSCVYSSLVISCVQTKTSSNNYCIIFS